MPEIVQSGGGVEGIPRVRDISPLMINKLMSYDYESSNSAPAAGFANQRVNDRSQLTINFTDKAPNDNTAFFSALKAGGYLNLNGINFLITGVSVGTSTATLTINPAQTAPPFGVTTLTFIDSPFPLFKPIVPPPVFGLGGGPPPTFPPPTPPPIGAIPPGVLVGPAIAPAPVPPSVAGFPLIQFKTGSATSPTAASVFPQFTTTFPVPTIVVDANNFAVANAGHIPPWTQPPPAQTASTAPIVLDGWGPGVPPGAPTSPGSDGRFPRSLAFEGMMVQPPPEDVTTTTWKPEPEPEPEPESEPESEPEPPKRGPPPRRRR